MMMNVSERVPSIIGEALNDGRSDDRELRHVLLHASWLRIFRNMVRANRLCHAFSVMMRMGRRTPGRRRRSNPARRHRGPAE